MIMQDYKNAPPPAQREQTIEHAIERGAIKCRRAYVAMMFALGHKSAARRRRDMRQRIRDDNGRGALRMLFDQGIHGSQS